MKKFWIILSYTAGREGNVAGVFGPGPGQYQYLKGIPTLKDSSENVRAAVEAELKSRMGGARYREYGKAGDDTVIFQTRKDARYMQKALGEEYWDWRVIEIGDATPRDVRPVLGWQIMYGPEVVSAFNEEAFDKQPYNMVKLSNGPAFKTRKAARAFWATRPRSEDFVYEGYTIQPVYGAWRVDIKGARGNWVEGSLRFRTRSAAEQVRSDWGSPLYRVAFHDQPVPEHKLYVP